jgi:membrane protein YqaA with SNARE-associated domain
MSLLVLFAWSFAASTVLPLSSEVPLALVVRASQAVLAPVIVATLGNTLGALTTYGLGRAAVKIADPTSPKVQRAATLLQRYGAPALLLSWVPIVGDAIVALAGAARVPPGAFAVWTVIGKAARYAAVGWIALRV